MIAIVSHHLSERSAFTAVFEAQGWSSMEADSIQKFRKSADAFGRASS